MRLGIHIHNHGAFADPRRLAELAREAEVAGWDGVFVCDYLMALSDDQPRPVASPWIALTAIAMATERVRLGPLVTPVSRRRPWQLAGEAVTLDHLSGGRLVLGVGSGAGLAESFTPFGEELDPRTRADRLDEGLAVLTGLWSGEPFSFTGQHYQLTDAVGLPRPVQSPRVPIWVAGSWPHRRPFRRAVRWDGVFIDIEGVDWLRGDLIAPDDLQPAISYLREQRQATTPFDIVIGGHLPDERSVAVARLTEYAEAGVTWWVEGIHEALGAVDDLRARVRAGPPRPN